MCAPSTVSCRAPRPTTSNTCWSAADGVLWVALAEALGYGQHREALRQAGIRLLAGDSLEPDFARRSERMRLGGLLALWDRWRVTGPWEPLCAALQTGPAAVIMALRVSDGAISASRARIMAANVVFPFAVALADLTGDTSLAERARVAYLESPGLPSNQITREMTRQLGLARHPNGAAAQQGLHHLWANWCHAKDCARCPCNPRRTASENPIGNRWLIRYDVSAASKEIAVSIWRRAIIIVIVKVRRGPLESRVWKRKINLFLLAIPIVLLNTQLHVGDWISEHLGLPGEPVLLVVAALGLIPLAGFVESAVEELAELLGPFIGGLLHTTFSNVAELFIALNILLTFAAPEGPEIVLSSVAGVIIRNSLLFLGVATFLGCLKNGKMKFNAEHAGEYATVFALAVIGLSLPTVAALIREPPLVAVAVRALRRMSPARRAHDCYISRGRTQ